MWRERYSSYLIWSPALLCSKISNNNLNTRLSSFLEQHTEGEIIRHDLICSVTLKTETERKGCKGKFFTLLGRLNRIECVVYVCGYENLRLVRAEKTMKRLRNLASWPVSGLASNKLRWRKTVKQDFRSRQRITSTYRRPRLIWMWVQGVAGIYSKVKLLQPFHRQSQMRNWKFSSCKIQINKHYNRKVQPDNFIAVLWDFNQRCKHQNQVINRGWPCHWRG